VLIPSPLVFPTKNLCQSAGCASSKRILRFLGPATSDGKRIFHAHPKQNGAWPERPCTAVFALYIQDIKFGRVNPTFLKLYILPGMNNLIHQVCFQGLDRVSGACTKNDAIGT
jgi:hypothetical protein